MSAQTGWRPLRRPSQIRWSFAIASACAVLSLAAIAIVGLRHDNEHTGDDRTAGAAAQGLLTTSTSAASAEGHRNYYLVTPADEATAQLLTSGNPPLGGEVVTVTTDGEATAFLDGIRDANQIRAGMGLPQIEVVDLRAAR